MDGEQHEMKWKQKNVNRRKLWKSQRGKCEPKASEEMCDVGWDGGKMSTKCIESLFISCFEFPFEWIEWWLISQNKWEQLFWLIESNFKKILSFDWNDSKFQRWTLRICLFLHFYSSLCVCVCANRSVYRVRAICFWLLLCFLIECVLSNIYVQSKSCKWIWPKMDAVDWMHVEKSRDSVACIPLYTDGQLLNCMCCAALCTCTCSGLHIVHTNERKCPGCRMNVWMSITMTL